MHALSTVHAMNERPERIDEIIERHVRGDASAQEIDLLAEWRRGALANERHYRQLARLLAAARELAPREDESAPPPNAATILARAGGATRPPPTPRADGMTGGGARPGASRWVPWLVAAAAVLMAAIGRSFPRSSAPVAAWGAADIITGHSEMATIQLPDGSVIRLAAASKLGFGNSPDRREVSLDGRAFFAVAKVPNRPFVVRTRHGNATALGTRFEVATEEDDLRLVVVEGRVALDATSNRVEVQGGEASGVRNGTALRPTPVSNAGGLERWVGKFLVFQATPMTAVARDVEAMYGLRVVLADSAIAERTVSVSFTDRSAEDVMKVVCAIVGARCASRAGEIVVASQ